MMRPAPVVFEVDKTARSVWLKVVPGANDNARMRSIVESVTFSYHSRPPALVRGRARDSEA